MLFSNSYCCSVMLARSYYFAKASSNYIYSMESMILLPSLSIISISYSFMASPSGPGLVASILLYLLLKLEVIDYFEVLEAVSIFFAPGWFSNPFRPFVLFFLILPRTSTNFLFDP
jgi:hypothetical protein